METSLGRPRFALLALLAGLLALAARAILHDGATAPLLYAATAAIAAILGAHLRLYPRARVISFVPIPFYVTVVEIPSVTLLAPWLAAQIALAAAALEPDLGAAAAPYLAHLGGFALGLVFVWPFAARLRRPLPPRLPVY